MEKCYNPLARLRYLMDDKCGCTWANSDPDIKKYHDHEWGRPVHDDRLLFEFLILEGAQAGLSWKTVFLKRDAYRKAFDNFIPEIVAQYDDKKTKELMANAGIIRNWRKIEAAVNNAKGVLQIQKEFGSFDSYVWGFVGGKPLKHEYQSMSEIPTESEESRALSKDLKRRGFSFVGPTICYSFMQAVGLVNDHVIGCPQHGLNKAAKEV
jgi:DNA-3-methyladenine glycosylase I